MSEGHVYFIRAVETGNVKIGWSEDVFARITALKTGTHLTLELAAVMPTTRKTEKALHEAFADSRVNGEWFAMSGRLQMLIVGLRDVFPVSPPDREPAAYVNHRPAASPEEMAEAIGLINAIGGARLATTSRADWLQGVARAAGLPAPRVVGMFYRKVKIIAHSEMEALRRAALAPMGDGPNGPASGEGS